MGNVEVSLDGDLFSEEKEPLAFEHVLEVFVHSFRHSQGMESLQKKIFTYLHAIHPHWKIDDELKERLTNPAIKAAAMLFHGESKTPHVKVGEPEGPGYRYQIAKQLGVMQAVFEAEILDKGDHKLNALKDLLNGVLEIEAKYISAGRPNRNPFIPVDQHTVYTHPHASFFVEFGLNGKSTGVAEYDQMYAELVATLRTIFLIEKPTKVEKILIENTSHFFEMYAKHHPISPLDLEIREFMKKQEERSDSGQLLKKNGIKSKWE